jgi:hypothetical protein
MPKKKSGPLTPEEVLVFGADAKRGPDGRPIEMGKGSASQQTSQHKEALARENDRKQLMERIIARG